MREPVQTGAVEPGVHPRRHPGFRPAHHEPQKAKRSTDYVGGPSRKIEASVVGQNALAGPAQGLTITVPVRLAEAGEE